MVYLSGVADHKIDDAHMVDHVVELVEAKAAEIEDARRAEAFAPWSKPIFPLRCWGLRARSYSCGSITIRRVSMTL